MCNAGELSGQQVWSLVGLDPFTLGSLGDSVDLVGLGFDSPSDSMGLGFDSPSDSINLACD